MHRLARRDGPGTFELGHAIGKILDLGVLREEHGGRCPGLGSRLGQLKDLVKFSCLTAGLQYHGPAAFFPDFRPFGCLSAGVDVMPDLIGR